MAFFRADINGYQQADGTYINVFDNSNYAIDGGKSTFKWDGRLISVTNVFTKEVNTFILPLFTDATKAVLAPDQFILNIPNERDIAYDVTMTLTKDIGFPPAVDGVYDCERIIFSTYYSKLVYDDQFEDLYGSVKTNCNTIHRKINNTDLMRLDLTRLAIHQVMRAAELFDPQRLQGHLDFIYDVGQNYDRLQQQTT